MTINQNSAKTILEYEPIRPNAYLVDNKIELILLLAGAKLACEWHLFGPEARTEAEAVPIGRVESRQLEILLQSVGVKFSLLGPAIINRGDDHHPQYCERLVYRLALTSEQLARMELVWCDPTGYPTEPRLHGTLSGFPTTAIDAFLNGPDTIMPARELPSDVLSSPAYAFARYALSRDHWRDELEIPAQWAVIIKQWSPTLYKYRLAEVARWHADRHQS